MAGLLLPDSNFYLHSARAGNDPFKILIAHEEEWEFATCGQIVLEVCRGRSLPTLRDRLHERLAVMMFIQTTGQIWERATQLAWALDRQGVVLPVADLVIAACAQQAGATLLTRDAHFKQVPGLDVIETLD